MRRRKDFFYAVSIVALRGAIFRDALSIGCHAYISARFPAFSINRKQMPRLL